MKTHLLIIDGQNDFCNPNGALCVVGADADMICLTAMVDRLRDKIDGITCTLDSHRTIDVAHPIYWVNSNGEHPAPFTIISADETANSTWMTTNPAWRQRGIDYTKALEDNTRYPLCIWSPHCRIGTWGHAIVPELSDALLAWEERFKAVNYVTKGSNPHTEHYSALIADVVDPSDPTTALNTDLLKTLENVDDILISGEALSHCVANTITDIANNFGDDNVKKFILLEDCCSNVTGFENLGKDFVKNMRARGMRVSTSVDYLV